MITTSLGWAAGYNSVILVVESSGLRLRLVSYGAINPELASVSPLAASSIGCSARSGGVGARRAVTYRQGS